MGYYTLHTLTVKGKNLTEQVVAELSEWLKKRSLVGCGCGLSEAQLYVSQSFDNEAVFEGMNEVKWYNHDDDMIECSKAFPDLTFRLNGEGEDPLDRWETYYHNGRSEECRLVWYIPEPRNIIWN